MSALVCWNVVYEVKCKNTNKSYIGNTGKSYKERMQGHFNDVKKLVERGESSDTYAAHFGEQLQNFKTVNPNKQRNSITGSIIWQGNPISAVKTFGTAHCVLCNKERLEILKRLKENPDSLINSCNEIYGGCRHRPKFHRFKQQYPSTDDSIMDEKVKPTNITTEV